MITDDRINELIDLGNENRNLDYKGAFSWANATKDEKVKITKDVLAFANTRDGGVILVGLDDKTGALQGLTEDESASFDQTRFNDFVHEFTDPKHTSFVCRRTIRGHRIIAIEIPEFVEVPILCKKMAQSTANPKELLLRKAGLYKRTEKATSELIEDPDELRELLNRGVLRRQDELLTAMNRILRPEKSTIVVNLESEFKKESEDARIFMQEVGNGELLKLPGWELTIHPDRFNPHLFSDLSAIQRSIRNSVVSLRGWNFPHINERDFSNFSDGFQSSTDWKDAPFGRYLEAFRAYRSGLFIWRGSLWEERAPEIHGVSGLSFLSVVFSITEWMIFAQRYYEPILPIGDRLHVKVDLQGSKGRKLIARPPLMPFTSDFLAKIEPVSVSEDVEMTDLRADSPAVARRCIKRILELFNFNDVAEATLQDWQRRLIERRL
jgi:hypothetical protein